MINRYYNNLGQYIKQGKVLILQGPRQVGKTTLVKNYLETLEKDYKYLYLTGDSIETMNIFSSQSKNIITNFASNIDLIVIDEAQKIPNIGLGLKILIDSIPEIKVITTGSSSFDLIKQVGEPLVGRSNRLMLYPVSLLELKTEYPNEYMLNQQLDKLLIYGLYPEVLNFETDEQRREYLITFVDMYLLKDVLEYSGIKGSQFLSDLLKLLAFQIGSLVSLTELSNQLQVNINTVQKYLDLLEKNYIIFSLGGYNRNLKKEVTSKKKYYFYDLGIRNALISNFNKIGVRDDIGAIWENFLVMERLKKQEYGKIYANNYFWRTWDQKEVDFVEERDGKLYGFEFKWGKARSNSTKLFTDTYKEASIEVINRDNYLEFVI